MSEFLHAPPQRRPALPLNEKNIDWQPRFRLSPHWASRIRGQWIAILVLFAGFCLAIGWQWSHTLQGAVVRSGGTYTVFRFQTFSERLRSIGSALWRLEIPAPVESYVEIELRGPNITDAWIDAHSSRLSRTQNLVRLSLSGCAISDKTLEKIALIPDLSALRLRNVNITDRGLEPILARDPLELTMAGTLATPRGVAELIRRKHWASLVVEPEFALALFREDLGQEEGHFVDIRLTHGTNDTVDQFAQCDIPRCVFQINLWDCSLTSDCAESLASLVDRTSVVVRWTDDDLVSGLRLHGLRRWGRCFGDDTLEFISPQLTTNEVD